MKIKTLFIGLLVVAMLLCVTACGSSVKETTESTPAGVSDQADTDTEPKDSEDKEQQDNNQNTGISESTEDPASSEKMDSSHSEVLVVYFSATGTTKDVAERIAAVTDADIYEIKAAVPYTDDDLNFNDSGSRTTLEQNDPDCRPEIGSDDISLEGYKTIYLGYPIWHGQAPRILSTFVEKYTFDDITVIPFCTSGSSGIGQSAVNLESQAGSGNWLQGERFSTDVSETELESWVDRLQ